MKKYILSFLLVLLTIVGFTQNSFDRWVPATAIVANTYTTNITGFPTSYNNTQLYLNFTSANTGNSTIKVGTLAAIPIRKWDGDSWELVTSGQIPLGSSGILNYDNINGYYRAVIFESIGGILNWGEIEGTLSDQTDLVTALNLKANLASPTFTGTVTLPSTTSIGTISSTELGYVDGTTSAIQPQIDAKQASLVSGTNIKTLESTSLLGSGNIDLVKGDVGLGNVDNTSDINKPISTLTQAALDLKKNLSDAYNTQTSSYPLVLSDASKIIEMNSASPNDVTVPLNSSVAYPIGTSIVIVQKGAGLTSVVATGGVTINTSSGTLNSPGQNAVMVLSKRAIDEWYLWNGLPGVTSIATTSPITGGTITSTGTIGITNSAADGSTKGAASFAAADFNATSGNISIDYTNGQEATTSLDGFLSSTDWNTFNNKLSTSAAWLTSGTSTITALSTITSNAAAQHLFNGTWTATANSQSHASFSGNFTSRNTGSDVMYGYSFTPTLTQNAGGPASQVLSAVSIRPTFSVTTATPYALDVAGNINISGATAKLIKINGATNLLDINVGTNSFSFTNSGGYGIILSTTDGQINSQGNITLRSQASTSNVFFMGDQSTSATTARIYADIKGGVPHVSTAYTPTSGVSALMRIGASNGNANFQPSSGTATHTSLIIGDLINQTGTATGAVTWFDINPTVTNITGIEYGILQRRATALSGFGVATPVSTLDVDGSVGVDITSTSVDLTLNATHCTILVDASGAARTITLPAASGCSRRMYIIKKTDASANVVTIDGNASETIDGATTQPLNTQYEYLKIQSNGTAWFIIGND